MHRTQEVGQPAGGHPVVRDAHQRAALRVVEVHEYVVEAGLQVRERVL